VETVEGDMFAQYGCLNFHAKRDGGPKLRLIVKNKWSSGWTKSWFYLRNFIGRTSVYALHSRMSMLDYTVESEVECLDSNANNTGFVRATATIRGRDAVEEFLACKMYPLAAGYGFKGVTIGTMLVLDPSAAISCRSSFYGGCCSCVGRVRDGGRKNFGQFQAERI
jgi:hypothetical protein